METIRCQARLAGALYALVAIVGPISLIYIPGQVFAPGAAPADHIRASEGLLRLGIASELFYQSVEVFLVLALYALFKPVNAGLARQMAVLGLMPIPIVLANLLNEIAALMMAHGAGAIGGLPKPMADSLAAGFLLLHGRGLEVAAVFWGLWLFPLGLLVIRCGFIPKLLGVLAMIAGAGYVIGSVVSLAAPQYGPSLGAAASMLELGELPIIAWLLLAGARPARTAPSA
ncbi:MAG TPA: DUF4386 domain-containing protein [Caulobacteraceae bacterium]